MGQTRDFDLLSRNEGLKHGKMSEAEEAVSGPRSLCYVMATRPHSPLCSSFPGK